MTNGNNDSWTFCNVGELAQCLVTASRMGRPIIPIVGAGISADSGFPVISSIIRYFGKLYGEIQNQLWLPGGEVGDSDPLAGMQNQYKKTPWNYIDDFGWPDRFQLNEDLLTASENSPERKRIAMSRAVSDGLDKLLEGTQLRRMTRLRDLRTSLENYVPVRSAQAAIAKFLGARKNRRLSPSENATEQILRKHLKELVQLRQKVKDDSTQAWGKSVAWDLFGDWKRMILDFTLFKNDYADALFARLAQNREPNLGHRYLAFLIRRLGIPVIFTMNFDPFIEQALDEEGLNPRIFAMEHGSTLPHSSLVREQLAVIKMHGSTHALLLDEQLDRPLSPKYLERFETIVGEDPLLLVIGCSGEDRRLLDLLRQAFQLRKKSESVSTITRQKRGETTVAWLHFEPANEMSGDVLALRDEKFLRFQRTKNIGATLLHIYSEIDHLHPTSRAVYLTHCQQPVLLENPAWDTNATNFKAALKSQKKLVLLESITKVRHPKTSFPEYSASAQLLLLGSSLPPGFNLIWVDLEAVHTLSAVAGSIIDQCRKYDPRLVPCVLPMDEDDKVIDNAVARVRRALRRSRYFIAFDGLETYTWSPTTHHGDTHSSFCARGGKTLANLITFLGRLARAKLGESRFALSVDPPRTRTEWDSQASRVLTNQIVRLKADATREIEIVELAPATIAYRMHYKEAGPGQLQGLRAWEPDRRSRWALALSTLATFRRSRPLALVYQVLEPILGEEDMREFLKANQTLKVFRQIEGGVIWFHREVRDHVYGSNTRATSACFMGKCLRGDPKTECGKTIFQLLLNAATHQLIARSWYGGAFIQSQDTIALLEYLYHRLASVRALTKVIGLLERDPVVVPDGHVAEGVETFTKVIGDAVDHVAFQDLFELNKTIFAKGRLYLRHELEQRHHEELYRLQRAWQRSERVLRAQVPAEQLLRWCEQFLDDDLKFRCDHIVTRYSTRTGRPIRPWPVACLSKHETSGDPMTLLTQYVRDFDAKVRMDRSDYAGCIAERDKELRHAEFNVIARLKRGPAHQFKPDTIRLIHHEVDKFACKLRKTQENTVRIKVLERKLARCAKALSQWEIPLLKRLREPGSSGLQEIQLRRLHILSNCWLGRLSVFSHEGFKGKTGKLGGLNAIAASIVIARGSAAARLQSKPQTSEPRSTAVNAVADGTLYLQYRAIFMMQHARLRWMELVNNNPLANSADSDGDSNGQKRQVAKHLLAETDEALREFEKARSGLAGTNNLTLALADLHGVEACLAHTRILLHPESSAEVTDEVKSYQLARSRHETARSLLIRARAALGASQRNVVWWRLFFQLGTQYHAERLLWDLSVLSEDSIPKRQLGYYLRRLRSGYGSLRSGYDLHLYDEKSNLKDEIIWLPRMGCELTLCGFAIGLVQWRPWEKKISERDATNYLKKQLNWLTKTAGLGGVHCDVLDSVGAFGCLWNATVDSVSKSALRQVVITLAAEHASSLSITRIIDPDTL